MTQKPEMPCLILAGGASERFGSDKGLAVLEGRPLIEHVIARLRAQTSGLVCVSAALDSPYASFGDVCLPDLLGVELGPLAGVHAGLSWASGQGIDRIVTCAVDTPFLPHNLIQEFKSAKGPAIAASGDRIHPVCGIWPVSLLPGLEKMLMQGERAARNWARICGASRVVFSTEAGLDPFFNINTTDDLAAVAAPT